MRIQHVNGNHSTLRAWTLVVMLIILVLLSSACADVSSPTSHLQNNPTSLPTRPAGPTQPTPTHPATNFLLTTPLTFSNASGATMDDNQNITPIDMKTIQDTITSEMKHLLFVLDATNTIRIYSPGTSPVTAPVISHSDGSMTIHYTQTLDSQAGSVTAIFDGILQKQYISVSYEQRYAPSILINAMASDVAVNFTTSVRWITANQIPAAPAYGSYQLQPNGGIALSWLAGRNAVAYTIYRLIADHDQQFQWLITVKSTSYVDHSADALQNVHTTKGIQYAIFSVGAANVENPEGIVIPVST